MDIAELMRRRRQFEDELTQPEGAAGITREAAERAWGLAFMPYGIGGDEMREFTDGQNNTLYFDNEHDDRARRVRALYFGVADTAARCKLIEKVLEQDDLHDRSCRDDVDKAKRALREAKQKEDDLGWLAAAILGIACVLVGYWLGSIIRLGNIVGAIAGAVAGVFLGMRIIFEKRTARRAARLPDPPGRLFLLPALKRRRARH